MTYKNKLKTVKRMVIATYILINVSGLHAPTKNTDWPGAGWGERHEKMCMYALSLSISLYLIPQTVCNYFILLG